MIKIDSSEITPEHVYFSRRKFLASMSAVFSPSELLSLIIPVLLTKNVRKLYDDISFCGFAYPGWVGQGLNLPLTYYSYPIEEVTHKALDMVMHHSLVNELPPEERYVDVTRLAKRVDKAGGSIKGVNP